MTPEIYCAYVRTCMPTAVDVYKNGKCFEFYKLLKVEFPKAEAYYDSDHVITKIDGKFYDITGEVEPGRHLLMSEHYPEQFMRGFTYENQ